MRFLAVAALLSLALTGCTLATTATPTAVSGSTIQGMVHGGQQPIVGAHVYVFAADITGYGGAGIAASSSNASTSLMSAATTGLSDSAGAYVLTGADGSFTITGDYGRTPGTNVYLYGLGGNTGAGVNSASGLMAVLGNCPLAGNFLAATPFVEVNEVSTVAAAYAMAGFATDATHISSTNSPLAQTGMTNAFANASNLVDLATGAALATTSGNSGGVVPQRAINTLANVLASCVNSSDSNGSISPACSTLFALTLSGGTTGAAPTDTASAAINIAHNPGVNIADLYPLATPTPPFAPALTAQPNDFILALNFSGGGLADPIALAVDGSGNVWVANGGHANPPTITRSSR